MLILQGDLIALIQMGSQGCQSQGWKQRILDGSPERTLCFRESWQDHFDFHNHSPTLTKVETFTDGQKYEGIYVAFHATWLSNGINLYQYSFCRAKNTIAVLEMV
jgi:hypothetical protein